jgi:hypothetical protein
MLGLLLLSEKPKVSNKGKSTKYCLLGMAVFPLMHAFADMLTFMQLQQVSCQLFI